MRFDFETSKRQTVHVNGDTLGKLEELRQQLSKNGKLPNYDSVIKFALNYLKAKGV
jgi:translation initiation factor IF-2